MHSATVSLNDLVVGGVYQVMVKGKLVTAKVWSVMQDGVTNMRGVRTAELVPCRKGAHRIYAAQGEIILPFATL